MGRIERARRVEEPMERKDALRSGRPHGFFWAWLLVGSLSGDALLLAEETAGARIINSLRRNPLSTTRSEESPGGGGSAEPQPLRRPSTPAVNESEGTDREFVPRVDTPRRGGSRRNVVRDDQATTDTTATAPATDDEPTNTDTTLPAVSADGDSADAATPQHLDLRAVEFKQVTPGETSAAQLIELWGQPLERSEQDGTQTWTFAVEPLKRVEVLVQEDRVSAIVLYLTEPETRDQLEADLGLQGLIPVVVSGPAGEALGLSFPERGVVCGYAAGSEGQRFAQVVLEPLSIEPFWLRAQDETGRAYQLYLADVEFILQHQAEFADAYWVKSKILAAAGRFKESLAAIEQALAMQENDARYRLARAVPRFELDQQESALEDLVAVLQDEQATELVRARARLQLGHFLQANGSRLDRDSLGHFAKAIELASPLAASELAETRREALHVLIEAYFASAVAISRGQWANKPQAVDKWLRTGAELAGAVLEGGEAQPELRLLAIQQTLSAYRGLKSPNDASSALDRLVKEAERLITANTDPIFQQQVVTIFIDGVLAAMEIAQLRDTEKVARQYAERGVAFLQQFDVNVITAPRTQKLVASFYFQVGLLEAIHDENHPLAIEAYEHAREYCDKVLPEATPNLLGKFGEWYVSMGISYWQAGSRDLAVELTQQGLTWMQTAERAGKLDKQALLVPMRNLSTMYRALDDHAAAEQMSTRAAALQESLSRPTRR